MLPHFTWCQIPGLVKAKSLLVPADELSIIDRQRALGLLRSAAGDGGLGVLMAVPDPPVMLHANEVRSLSRAR